MTDNLRDRIAAAIDLELERQSEEPFGSISGNVLADAVIAELDKDFVDFGLWLAEEITGSTMTSIDLESCLADWKAGNDA